MSGILASLIARRLCHDFAGPVGAIGAALDMLADVVRKEDAELVDLVADSAQGLSAALRLYRFVLNPASQPVGSGLARGFVADWIKTREGMTLVWPDDLDWPPGIAELTAGLALCVAELASRGGTLQVAAGVVRLAATTFNVPEDFAAVFAGTTIPVTTKLALPGCLAEQAAALGGRIAVDSAAGGLTVRYQGNGLP